MRGPRDCHASSNPAERTHIGFPSSTVESTADQLATHTSHNKVWGFKYYLPILPIRSHMSPRIGIWVSVFSYGSQTFCPWASARVSLARCPSSPGWARLRANIPDQFSLAGYLTTSSSRRSGVPREVYIKRSIRPFHSSRRSLVRLSKYGSLTILEKNIDELRQWMKKKSSFISRSECCAVLV